MAGTGIVPDGRSGLQRITVGAWRKKESGPCRLSRSHRARRSTLKPPAMIGLKAKCPHLKWLNGTAETFVLKSALAHFCL